MLLYDIIHYGQRYFLQGIPTETANVYTFSVYILVYMSGIIQVKCDSIFAEKWLSGNIWLVSFKISYLCLPLFYETRTTPSCHPSGCAYRQL